MLSGLKVVQAYTTFQEFDLIRFQVNLGWKRFQVNLDWKEVLQPVEEAHVKTFNKNSKIDINTRKNFYGVVHVTPTAGLLLTRNTHCRPATHT
jgi:hypothetical protein